MVKHTLRLFLCFAYFIGCVTAMYLLNKKCILKNNDYNILLNCSESFRGCPGVGGTVKEAKDIHFSVSSVSGNISSFHSHAIERI